VRSDLHDIRRREAGEDVDMPPILYKGAVDLGAKILVEPSVPRVASVQRHRANAPSSTTEEHYRRNLILPFIDGIISEVHAR
jgi:hypothetical protein